MRNIDSFIIHVVNNLFPLNEYSEGEIKRLMDQFKEEADDLNIDISDANLEAAIKRFDQLKNSPKITDKDLRKYSLAKLLKITGTSEGAETPEEETGPDVVYSENGYTIFSGGNEELCQRHRDEVPWCITKTSFGNYRYSADRNYPSFYLVKNANLPDSDPLSFVAIQVRSNGEYVFTNRNNSPHESREMSWETLNSNIPWLRNIPNAKSLMRYVPLSTKEKLTQLYERNPISIRKWETLPFSEKKQYLVVRKNNTLFSDISVNEFIEKYLPDYPQLAAFIATNAGIISPIALLKNLDKFSVNDRKSITANLREKIELEELERNNLPFDVKKLLVKLDKWNTGVDERLYVTSNGEAIVKLKFKEGDVQVGIFTDERDYPNIKLNARTAKYLTEYPDLDKLPLPTILKLVDKEVVNADFVSKVLEKAQADPDSAIVIKDTDAGKIILDSNSFSSYKIENGKLKPVPFNSEEVQNVLQGETENTGFQSSAVNLVFQGEDLPSNIDKDSFLNILNNTPYSQRIGTARNQANAVILVNPQAEIGAGKAIFTIPSSIGAIESSTITDYGRSGEWTRYDYSNRIQDQEWPIIIQYYKDTNQKFTDGKIRSLLSSIRNDDNARTIVQSNPPMADGSTLRPVVVGDNVLLVNTVDPRSSFIVSNRSGKLLNKVISPAQARQILGGAVAPEAPATQRRPRQAAAPAAPAPAAPAAAGEANAAVNTAIGNAGLAAGFNSLPTSVKNRIRAGNITPYTRRNASIDAIGRVIRLIAAGQSRFYIIQMPSGRIIGFATMQPDAKHYIVTINASFRVPRVNQLAASLQQNNISEGLKTLIRLHSVAMPEEVNEMKQLLKSLKNKKK